MRSVLGLCFKSGGVYATFLKGLLGVVLVPFFRSSWVSIAILHLSVKDLSRKASLGHPDGVSNPLKMLSCNGRLYGGSSCPFKDDIIKNMVLPCYSKNPSKAHYVEGLELLNVSSIWCPCFCAVKQGR